MQLFTQFFQQWHIAILIPFALCDTMHLYSASRWVENRAKKKKNASQLRSNATIHVTSELASHLHEEMCDESTRHQSKCLKSSHRNLSSWPNLITTVSPPNIKTDRKSSFESHLQNSYKTIILYSLDFTSINAIYTIDFENGLT